MAEKCPIHSGPDTQAVALLFLLLGWSMIKVIELSKFPSGNIKFHYICYKTDQYLGYWETYLRKFMLLPFCSWPPFFHKSKKFSFSFSHVYSTVPISITLLPDCLYSCFLSSSVLNLAIYGVRITVYYHDMQILSLKIVDVPSKCHGTLPYSWENPKCSG